MRFNCHTHLKWCCIEPENNIHIVTEAFVKLPIYYCQIVGNWNNRNMGKELKEKYKHFSNIHLLDLIL